MVLKEAIAKRIKEELIKRNISQYKLSQISGVPQSTITTILNYDIKTIKLNTLYDICSGLGIELKDFFDTEYFKLENLDD